MGYTKLSNIKVYHFHNGMEGGVLSVIKNLLKASVLPEIENHVIHVVNKRVYPNYFIETIDGACSQQLYFYDNHNNFYHSCRQLKRLLPDENALIVAHDWLELGLISHLGLRNRVIQFVHGDYDYYYHLAQQHEASIDKFIAIASPIAINLKHNLPNRINDIGYWRFPVPELRLKKAIRTGKNIVFVGRLSSEKGYDILPQIDECLRKKNIFMHWHIVGKLEGRCTSATQKNWEDSPSVKLYGQLNNEAVLALLKAMDFIVLPSKAEGMPVALIEAMKLGVIPIVNDINGGVQELVQRNITGYTISGNLPNYYARVVAKLLSNKCLAASLRHNCSAMANKWFNPAVNTRLIEQQYVELMQLPLKRKPKIKIYGSRLDQYWLPNFVTRTARIIQQKF